MALIRTILALVILLILAHMTLAYVQIGADTNGVTEVVYSLGTLLESPAQALLNVLPLPAEQRDFVNQNNFYTVVVTAVVGYFILYLLLGVGRRR